MIVVASEGPHQVRAHVRPNRQCFLYLGDCPPEACGRLLDAALRSLDGDVYIEVDESAAGVLGELTARGFTVHRRDHLYVVPTAPARPGPGAPAGFAIVSADAVDVDRLRELDDALRQDVPGGAGWRNDPGEFPAQTFGDPEFDPATYLVAIDDAGEYAGLVRVWIRPSMPRLGLIGTLPRYRRRGLARALLARAFGVVADRGQPEVTCEVDETNTASNALMAGLGARRVGGSVELVRR